MALGPERKTAAGETPEREPRRRASLGVLLVLAGIVITLAWIGLLLWAAIRLIVMLL